MPCPIDHIDRIMIWSSLKWKISSTPICLIKWYLVCAYSMGWCNVYRIHTVLSILCALFSLAILLQYIALFPALLSYSLCLPITLFPFMYRVAMTHVCIRVVKETQASQGAFPMHDGWQLLDHHNLIMSNLWIDRKLVNSVCFDYRGC